MQSVLDMIPQQSQAKIQNEEAETSDQASDVSFEHFRSSYNFFFRRAQFNKNVRLNNNFDIAYLDYNLIRFNWM